VLEDGVTGFIVRDVGEAVAALARIPALDRHLIRKVFESRFTVERMARDYLDIYRSLPGVRRATDLFLPPPLPLVPEPVLRAAE
jgi:hypothetical protein